MNYEPIPTTRVLALDPFTKGFGFVVLEDEPLQLVDWGVASCRRADSSCLDSVQRLIARYDPTVLAIEDWKTAAPLRRAALEHFINRIGEALVTTTLPVATYSRPEIRRVLASERVLTKHDLAVVLTARFPELAPKLPRHRRIWESEDSRMAIFDALALSITHLSSAAS